MGSGGVVLFLKRIIASSSITLRLATYFFLRWIPGHHFPPIIYALGALYFSSLFYYQSFLAHPRTNEKKDNVSQTEPGVIHGSVLSCLVTGIPSLKSFRGNLLVVLVNVVAIFWTVDVVYRGPFLYPSHDVSFCRAGYVSDTEASLLLREPDATLVPIGVKYRTALELGPFVAGSNISSLSPEQDFTAQVRIENLIPDLEYEYIFSNECQGFFRTAPAPNSGPSRYPFTFLFTSCIKPRFPFRPFDHPLRIPGLDYLAPLIPQLGAQFMMFLGDFIYIDVPHRFGTDRETYRREYRQVYASPSWPGVSRKLPWLHVIDDHELANDWDKNTTGIWSSAIDPWNIYHSSVNPPAVRPGGSYFKFTQGPASFFMLDTRRYRSPEFESSPESSEKTMLGAAQLEDLTKWLRTPNPTGVKWKFVISSVPFTKNWQVNAQDTWAGYLYERRLVLEAMWDAGLYGDGVVVLSGDRHEFAATRFPPPKNSTKWGPDVAVHEFSTSPLSMFYLPIRTYWQARWDEEDEAIKYLPDGNSKFSAIDVFRLPPFERGKLNLRLFIDGQETWNYTLTSPPMKK